MQQRRTLLLALLLGVIAMCAYAPSLGGGYIFDDRSLIEHNPYIHSFAWWKRWFTTDFWDLGLRAASTEPRLTYYRPLVVFSYAVDWAFGGGHPDLYHVNNLLWHAAGCVLAFYTLRRWVGSTVPALLAALLLAVHPTRAESVAWIAGRPDPMCMVFLLLATTGVARRLRGQRFGVVLEVVGTVGAYLSKETALVLPLFPMVEAWVCSGRPALDRPALLRMFRAALPQIAGAAMYLGLRSALLPLGSNVQVESQVRSLAHRPQLVLETFGRATELLLLPRDMYVQRSMFVFDAQGKLQLSWPYAALGLVALGTLLATVVRSRRRNPGLSAGLAFLLLAFLPTSNLRPTELPSVISERFLYIPMLGAGLALACLLTRLTGRFHALLSHGATGLAASALAFGSLNRSADYADEVAYWNHELRVNPISVAALEAQIDIATREMRYEAALRWIKRAHEVSTRVYRGTGTDISMLTKALRLIAALTNDAEKQELREIADTYARLIDAPLGKISYSHPKAQLAFEITPAIQRTLKGGRPAFCLARAEVLARLGDDAEATSMIDRALRACPDCRGFLISAPLPLAASGDYRRARTLLAKYRSVTLEADAAFTNSLRLIDQAEHWRRAAEHLAPGPELTHARAMELSALGYFGRAYDLMRPHETDFIDLADVALGYADLAWRAGHLDTARRVLRRHFPEQRVTELTSRWDEALGRNP